MTLPEKDHSNQAVSNILSAPVCVYDNKQTPPDITQSNKPSLTKEGLKNYHEAESTPLGECQPELIASLRQDLLQRY